MIFFFKKKKDQLENELIIYMGMHTKWSQAFNQRKLFVNII